MNDLFLELKETQCREKGPNKAQGREGGTEEPRPAGPCPTRSARRQPGKAPSPPPSRHARLSGQAVSLKGGGTCDIKKCKTLETVMTYLQPVSEPLGLIHGAGHVHVTESADRNTWSFTAFLNVNVFAKPRPQSYNVAVSRGCDCKLLSRPPRGPTPRGPHMKSGTRSCPPEPDSSATINAHLERPLSKRCLMSH